ncbi:MAG: DUF362 domain-containing protein [bacterium]
MSEAERRNDRITRRRFLKRAAKSGLSIAAAGSLAYWLHDAVGPSAARAAKTTIALPDGSIPSLGSRMAVVEGKNRAESLKRGLDALGGIQAFVQRGDRVVVKVNAAFASPPMLGATTHPELVGEMVRLCLRAGAVEVRVVDNPINDPASCFRLTGIGEATEQAGGKLILPRQDFFKPFTLAGGELIRNWPVLATPLDGANKIIGLAPLKDHHRAGASMTMKNWYGFLGGRRNIFHQDIHNTVKELAMMVRPTLVVLDATVAMMTNGPTGGSLSDLKEIKTLIVSTDQVAADALGCELLGKAIADLPYIAKAAEAGVGTADYKSLNPIRIAA